ncbi:MAG: phospholipase D family protein [Burkholderiaceae bacterium]|nr:phospholipase D family protein [Burkholderiaceae bacterium]
MKKNGTHLISPELWEAVMQEPREGMPTLATIAYYSLDLLNLRAGDELVCDASDTTIASGSSSAQLLLALHRKGVKVYNEPTLHAKVACIGDHVIIGSGNASENSHRNLIEAAVFSRDSALRAQAMALVRTLACPIKQGLLAERLGETIDPVARPPHLHSHYAN